MNRKSGIILGISLIIFLVISIIGAALITVVMGRAKQTNDLEKRTQAYFFAKSGVEIAREYAKQKEQDDQQFFDGKVFLLYGDLHDESTSFEFYRQDVTNIWSSNIRESFEASSSSFKNYDIVTAIWKDGNITNFLSAGNAGDMSRKVAFQYRRATSSSGGSFTTPVFDMAVFAENYIELTGSSKIDGSVGTNASSFVNDKQGIKLAWSTEISGNVSVGFGATPTSSAISGRPENIKGNSTTLDSTRTYEQAAFPQEFPSLEAKGTLSTDISGQEYTISEDGYYETIRLHSDRTIKIDTGAAGNIRRIVVDNANFVQGKIVLLGEGILEMYVRSFLSKNFLQGSTQFNCEEVNNQGKKEYVGDSERLRIFYEGSKELRISGDARIKGILHSKKSDIFVGGSNAFYGLIVSGGQRVEISGNSTADVVAIYAPEADVFLQGSSEINGAVVCKKFYGLGNVRVNHKSDIGETFPPQTIGITDPGTETEIELWGE